MIIEKFNEFRRRRIISEPEDTNNFTNGKVENLTLTREQTFQSFIWLTREPAWFSLLPGRTTVKRH